ncbi:hypothetical protein MJO28_009287 [Puccinia striiformis f. sp. tritici]|uniref:Uncharacterized protein n=4 Tax=Puccinia striiformis TaxID=27350 RepID=A0A0L0VWX4_9BASI|nr:hypothetical protein Pst134EB_018671 [Puccinia striiformis f. sp. tritici]KNF03819.1 hypothetical protein PSTG_02912 [Puccinia striiformis f. sp. tritici PST-78]POW14837.1 hypothetical protein PSTT_02637 [Puccinia striiformis]KAI7947379.1 hypothetical protein MJO28_009287 [Puccinia striiformis f. sp. tritici]KAI7950295.1 hypothetical protein MJO29_008969 [Puccinia striiformis f. sp. tritici]
MIGRVILAILCHSAYLNIFTVILNAPAGVVAPPTFAGEEAESVAHEASGVRFANSATRDLVGGGGELSRSGPRGENPLRDATVPTTYNVKVSDEGYLLSLIEAREEEVLTAQLEMDIHGSQVLRDILEHPDKASSLEKLAAIEIALKERRSERLWASVSNRYPTIFKSNYQSKKQDQLAIKLKTLKEISPVERVKPPEARLAIRRLSILEYKGLEFSKEQAQLIENLSEQAQSMNKKSSKLSQLMYSSADCIRFVLSDQDKVLINQIAWKDVVGHKFREITSEINYISKLTRLNPGKIDQDASYICQALRSMQLIMCYDTARWSPETSRLLENIKNMEIDEAGYPMLVLDEKNRKTISHLRSIGRRILYENQSTKTPAAANSAS